MLFNSYIFIFLFLPLSLLGWYGLNRIGAYKAAGLYLTAMSLWFYGYFNISYLILMVVSIGGNYLISLLMDKKVIKGRIALAMGLLLNLGLLFYFKYYDFFISNINAVFKTGFNLKNILLPLGISFFTFQQLSYIIDRYKGKAVHYSFIEYAAFVTFFPQLVAGPIVLHSEFVPQFDDVAKRRFNPEMFYEGLISFVIGLSKKVLLADTLAVIVNKGFDNYLLLDTFSTVIVMAAYFLELYFDFSGYSDMAIGMGLMFGIKLPVNFNSPYKSASLKELWTRWHMTLTRFMTTYVYIPLGGSRKGKARTYLNVFIVFVLSGLWHGAAWTYVVWGVFTGIIVIWDNLGLIKPGRRLGVLMTDITFTLLLIPFRSPDLGVAAAMFRNLIKGWTGNVLRLATDTMNMPELYVPLQITERLLPGKEPVVNVILMLVLIGIGMIVIAGQNAQYIRQNLASKKYTPPVLALLFIYSVISFSRVSTFIYFNF